MLCIIDIYSKFACVIPLKDKKGITITNASKNSSFEKVYIDKLDDMVNQCSNIYRITIKIKPST